MDKKSPDAFRTISEVADWLGVPTHVLRFWESRFSQVKPVKRAGGRRYYRPNDMELLGGIRKLLHDDGMTIRGVQKLLREEGVKHVAAMSPPLDSSEMRDVTPSNVVPLDRGSSAATEETAPEPDATTNDIEATEDFAEDTPAPVVEQPAAPQITEDASPNTEDLVASVVSETPQTEEMPTGDSPVPKQHDEPLEHTASAPEEPADVVEETNSEDDVADPTDDVQAPLFGSARSTPDAVSDPVAEVDADTNQPLDSEGSALSGDATSPVPAPVGDISHIAADPTDDAEVAGRPLIVTAIRHARSTGTNAHIAALQALADRLEALGHQVGGARSHTPPDNTL